MNKILLLSATDYEHNCKEINGVPIYLTGIGKINAAINTTRLIEKHNPDIVINFGSCGNLKDFKLGEVLKISSVINDIDTKDFYIPEELFLPTGNVKCLTTDHMYDPSDSHLDSYKDKINECDIVDMELYSIVKSCILAEKIVYSYKWVSDDGSQDQWLKYAKLGFESFKEILIDEFKL